MSDTYWAQPAISEPGVLSIDVLHKAHELAMKGSPEPNLIVMHPLRYEQWTILADAVARKVFLRGYLAACGKRFKNIRNAYRKAEDAWGKYACEEGTRRYEAKRKAA